MQVRLLLFIHRQRTKGAALRCSTVCKITDGISGSVAQELERLFPSRNPAWLRAQVVYQDLLALLTTLAQTQEARQKSLEEQVSAQQRLITALQDAVFDLQRRMASVEESPPRAAEI